MTVDIWLVVVIAAIALCVGVLIGIDVAGYCGWMGLDNDKEE